MLSSVEVFDGIEFLDLRPFSLADAKDRPKSVSTAGEIKNGTEKGPSSSRPSAHFVDLGRQMCRMRP